MHVSGFTELNRTVCCFLCLQVDLGFLRYVTSIGTQGAISIETKKQYYVRSYKVDLSTNGEDWITVKEGSKQKAKINYFTVLSLIFTLKRLASLRSRCQFASIKPTLSILMHLFCFAKYHFYRFGKQLKNINIVG